MVPFRLLDSPTGAAEGLSFYSWNGYAMLTQIAIPIFFLRRSSATALLLL